MLSSRDLFAKVRPVARVVLGWAACAALVTAASVLLPAAPDDDEDFLRELVSNASDALPALLPLLGGLSASPVRYIGPPAAHVVRSVAAQFAFGPVEPNGVTDAMISRVDVVLSLGAVTDL